MGVKSSGLLSHQRHAGWAAFRQGMRVCGQCCKGYPLIPTSRKSLTQGGGAKRELTKRQHTLGKLHTSQRRRISAPLANSSAPLGVAVVLSIGMADGAAGSGRRKRARRGGETPLDDAEATNAVCPRSETTVPASGAYACLRRAREAAPLRLSAASAPCRM